MTRLAGSFKLSTMIREASKWPKKGREASNLPEMVGTFHRRLFKASSEKKKKPFHLYEKAERAESFSRLVGNCIGFRSKKW